MVLEAADFADIPPDLIDAVKFMDGVLNLCDPAAPLQVTLTESQLQAMIGVGAQIRGLASARMLCAA